MATNPKLKPCPKCGCADGLAIYAYEAGNRHVECNFCFYLGRGENSIRQAIKSHNAAATSQAIAEKRGVTPPGSKGADPEMPAEGWKQP